MESDFIEIPYVSLSPEVLKGIIEEFILREGTDYGSEEFSLEAKSKQVLEQLKKGKAKILFFHKTESCELVLR